MTSSRDKWDAIVVGAGLGGLGCGATLARSGLKVLVLERHNKVGGYAHQFVRKAGPGIEYRFDVALHITGGFDEGAPLHTLFQEMGLWDRIEVKRLDKIMHCVFPDFEFTIPADKDLFRQRLIAQFPDDRDGVEAMLDTMDRFGRELAAMRSSRGAGAANPAEFTQNDPTVAKYMTASLSEYVRDHTKNEKIGAVFGQLHGYLGLPPKRLSAFVYLQILLSFFNEGAYYIQGGGYALSRALSGCIEENGGKVLTRTEVARILVEQGRAVGVETKKGETVRAPVVVSNAPAPLTFEKLVDASAVEPGYLGQVRGAEISSSAIQAYIGLKGTPEEIGFEEHDYFVNAGYDLDGQFESHLAEDYSSGSFGMANNTVVNPGDTPEGRSIVEVLLFADGKRWCGLPKEEYKRKKAEVTEVLLDYASRVIPDIRDRIEVIEVGTPHTMERYTLNPYGAVFSYSTTPTGHTRFRPRPETPLPGLYLASTWTTSGPGFGPAVAGGMSTARKILKKTQAAQAVQPAT
jgi:prolycopene isomerase